MACFVSRGDDVFLISEKNLDFQPYNNSSTENVTWETSTLRTWLNSDFYYQAFNDDEQQAIKNTLVINDDNPYYNDNLDMDQQSPEFWDNL